MRAYMKNMNLNAIINTVQKTYSGSPEWDRIKAFVDRVNKDPHGVSLCSVHLLSQFFLLLVIKNKQSVFQAIN